MSNKNFQMQPNLIHKNEKLNNNSTISSYQHTPHSKTTSYDSNHSLRQNLTCKINSSAQNIYKIKSPPQIDPLSIASQYSNSKNNIRQILNGESPLKQQLTKSHSRLLSPSYSQKNIFKQVCQTQTKDNKFLNQQEFGTLYRKQQDIQKIQNKKEILDIPQKVTIPKAINNIDRIENKFKYYLELDQISQKAKQNQQKQYEKLITIKKMYQEELEMLRQRKKNKVKNQLMSAQTQKTDVYEAVSQSKQPIKNLLKQSTSSLPLSLKQQQSSQPRTSISSFNSDTGKEETKNQSQKNILIQFQDTPTIQDFIILGNKGNGAEGQILLTIHKKTGAIFAIKKIKKSEVVENQLVQYIIRQIKIQASLNHPNIIKIYGVFDDKQHICLVLEYAQQGSLHECMQKRNYHKSNQKLFSENKLSQYLRDIMNALQTLHTHQIIHRDIKPGNIVMTHNVCKLCDFGWAAINSQKQRRTTYCGTLDYAAPQIFKGCEYDVTVDLWQFGVMAYEMTTGKLPFYMKSKEQTLKKVMNVLIDLTKYNGNLQFPKHTSELAKDFLVKLLQKEPEKRASISEMLKHALIRKYLSE